MGQRAGITWNHFRDGELWSSTHGVQEIRRKCQVEHFFDNNAAYHFDGFEIASWLDRVKRTEIRGNRRVFQLNRPVQMLPEVLHRTDSSNRRSTQSHTGLRSRGFGLYGDEGCRINLIHGSGPRRLMHHRPTTAPTCDSSGRIFCEYLSLSHFVGLPCHRNDDVKVRFVSSPVSHAPARRVPR
jgi:hypothetical protein